MKPAAQRTNCNHLLKILFLMALLIFIVIAVFVHINPDNVLDRYIQELTHPLATPTLLRFWIRISFFGSFEFLFPAYVIFIGICIWQRKVRFGLSVASLAIGGFLSIEVLKQIFQRHRPLTSLIPNFTDYSFPSGHSTSSLIFCAVMTYSLWQLSVSRSLRMAGMILMITLAFSVGLSRIVLNVHNPTDVIAGFCFGILCVIGWYWFIRKKI
jgi:membrane-associated phospholipid phosphatase